MVQTTFISNEEENKSKFIDPSFNSLVLLRQNKVLSNTDVIYDKSIECGGVCVYYQLYSVDIRKTSAISIGLLLNQIERHRHAFL